MNNSYHQSRSRITTIFLLVLLGTIPSCISAFLSITPKTSPLSIGPSAPSFSTRHVPIPKSFDIGNHIISTSGRNGRGNHGASSTALSALPLPKIATIAKFYKAFPIVAGFLTASTKAAFADSMAQYRDVCTTKFDVRRNLAMVLYSGTILGVSCEIMYNRIFPLLFGVAGAEKDILLAMKMTLFDGFVNAPLLWLPPAYIAQALVYRYPKRQALQKYVVDVKENGLLKKYWSLWLPMSMINFLLIPTHFRVAFVAAVSFFWMVILSVVANKEQDVESCPVEPEPAMLNPRALD
mmetsp:Transcript_12479/g.26565  ORF Transcript_12479/g.26565 Transcript_12479/m.26565 type:complete len:294 (-) Transcript_12479:172-1053(-)